MKAKFRKSVYIPILFTIYAICMDLVFGPRLISEGMATKFWVSVGIEIIVIVALFFALRKKEKLSGEWEKRPTLRDQTNRQPKD